MAINRDRQEKNAAGGVPAFVSFFTQLRKPRPVTPRLLVLNSADLAAEMNRESDFVFVLKRFAENGFKIVLASTDSTSTRVHETLKENGIAFESYTVTQGLLATAKSLSESHGISQDNVYLFERNRSEYEATQREGYSNTYFIGERSLVRLLQQIARDTGIMFSPGKRH